MTHVDLRNVQAGGKVAGPLPKTQLRKVSFQAVKGVIPAEKSGRENEGCEEPTRKEVSKDVTLYAGEEN